MAGMWDTLAADRYGWAKRYATQAVAKTWVWEQIGEAIEQDFHSALKKLWQSIWWLRGGEWYFCPQWGWGAVTLTECIVRL